MEYTIRFVFRFLILAETEYVFRLFFSFVFPKPVLACFKLVGEVERVLNWLERWREQY